MSLDPEPLCPLIPSSEALPAAAVAQGSAWHRDQEPRGATDPAQPGNPKKSLGNGCSL